MNLDDYSFTTVNESGLEVTCDTLLVLYPEDEIGDTYIIYTDYSLDEDNKFKVYAAKVTYEEENYKLLNIEDEQVSTQIKDALIKINAQLNK